MKQIKFGSKRKPKPKADKFFGTREDFFREQARLKRIEREQEEKENCEVIRQD
jgi:hypothetical protein